ncbi:phenylalanine--tRNA ligase subunit beta [Segnochrobactrum spirostomi]|uniref:Phenylalanine--tRNA ligase beta subunit n=1 Tax=Segnochrobactrum spirostomi TaxID=2608987 RepID=A0A6A7XXX3_9HYPH|nr:phenylalanine--tRNA ligase subunit beta [Segnochrobactrum spirostomi]MQT11188.1 phenylalanine--tRNA ligase subunit beta [Segnochrobactrum spirostomi]
MKFTLSWLKDHLETDASLDAIVDRLTTVGLEVEGVENPGAALEPFVIASVVSAEKHPNADKLRVCMVETGAGEPIQVVCGAPNARAGMKAVFAAPGTHVPGTGVDLKVGTIRGVESRGMLVSERELGLSDEHNGIIELPADAPVGTAYADWAGLGDPVIEIAVTPNRADCLGIQGIARDLAASGLGRVITPAIAPVADAFPCPTGVRLEFGDTAPLSPLFALRLVRGVRNGPSPDWMQRRLKAIGLRPISALVDITNYMTFDRGRPLHVFDAAKVKGDLVVRRGRPGETLLALDGRTYEVDDAICVIADDQGLESLAGIMGGETSGVTEATTDVLIESALWDALNIAQTGRRLGLNSDARFRFERGVDPAMTVPGLELATKLVVDLCGGTPSAIVVAGSTEIATRTIEFPLSEVARLSGLDVDAATIVGHLESLGFTVAGDGAVRRVTPPSWRGDIEGKADLVEEVVRMVGLDRVPLKPMARTAPIGTRVLTLGQLRARNARRTLASRGLVEAVTWSFLSKAQATAFGGGAPELALSNPIASDLSDMRPSLIPGLASAAQRNADRGFGDTALFEVGQIFLGDKPEDQKRAAAGLRRGTAGLAGSGRHWQGAAKPVDAFDAKADALAVLDAIGAPADRVQITRDAPAWFHPGRSGTLRLGPIVLGHFGELHPAALEALDVTGPIAAFEILIEAAPAQKARPTRAKPPIAVSDLMPVRRDFAFVVPRATASADIVKAATQAEKTLIERVSVFDLYEGPGVAEGAKSIAIEVVLAPKERTLTDAEIEAVAGRIVAGVEKATGGVLRR